MPALVECNTMQVIKYLFVVVVAVCAAQGAEIPRSADKLDLRLFVDNVAAISRNVFKAINTALDQSKPNSDKMINELAPEARTLIRRIIGEARATINEEDKRFTVIFATLTKALDSIKPVKTCTDKVSPAGKKLALATEKDVVKIVDGIEKKYKKELDNIKTGKNKLLQKARTLFDTEVPAVVKCLTPGKKDSAACLQKELNKIINGVTEIVTDGLTFVNTVNETMEPIIGDVLDKGLPLLQKVIKDGEKLLKTLGDCVATLK